MAIRMWLFEDPAGPPAPIELAVPSTVRSPQDLHSAVLPIEERWSACTKGVVDANEHPAEALHVLGLLWAMRIRPTVLLLDASVKTDFRLLDGFQLPANRTLFYRYNVTADGWMKQAGHRAGAVVLSLVAEPVWPDVQRAWSQVWWEHLATERAHATANRLAGLRFLRGAVMQGYMTPHDYKTATVLLGTRDLADLVPPRADSAAPSAGVRGKVLSVEDEPYWEALIRPVLRREGLALETRTTVHQTLNLLEHSASEYGAVILDLHFPLEPELKPMDVIEGVRKVAPQLPVVVFSSELDARIFNQISSRVFRFLFKVEEQVGEADPVAYVERFRNTVLEAARSSGVKV